MLYRKLGKTGLKISAISLGSWQTFGQSVADDETEACLQAAYDAGVNFFDGAEAYGSGAADAAVGRALKKHGWPRDTYLLSGKCIRGGDRPDQKGLSRKRLRNCCDNTLQRYGTDHLELFFCHRPDPDTPLEEIVTTMNALIQQGKILYWGTSEFSAADLMKLWAIADANGMEGPVVEQTGANMLARDRIENQLVPLFDHYGMGTTIYSPLAVGLLTGKYNESTPSDSRLGNPDAPEWMKKHLSEERLEKARKIGAIAKELGITQAHLALAWLLRNPNVSTCLTGARQAKQVEENVKAVEAVDKLSDEVMSRLREIIE